MSATLFPTGMDKAFTDWTGDTYEWGLFLATLTPDPTTQVFLASITADELTDASYARVPFSTPVKTIGLTGTGSIFYTCDGPNFGVIAGGEVAAWLVLYRFVTNDADSELVAALPCAYTADGLATALFVLPSSGAVSAAFACPSGFY